jgi:diketogulonate reductase-like aldo/keto reductase
VWAKKLLLLFQFIFVYCIIIVQIANKVGIKKKLFQVECHPYLNQSKMIALCKERGIVVIAYAPFGRPGSKVDYIRHDVPSLLEDSKLQEIAAKRGKTVAQVILRYLVSNNNKSLHSVV